MDLLSRVPEKLRRFATLSPQKHGSEPELIWGFPSIKGSAKKGDIEDNDICVFCGDWCVGKGLSNRYHMLQGSFSGTKNPPCVVDEEYNISVVKFCDECADQKGCFDDGVSEIEILGLTFGIDSSARMND